MLIKRLISTLMAICLAFSVSTAMAAKSSKNDKSSKGSSYSQDKENGRGKGKKDGNSEKSNKSGKSEKSGKSVKPTFCVTSYAPIYLDPVDVDGTIFYDSGLVEGLVCSTLEWEAAVNGLYGTEVDPLLECYVELVDETIPVVGPDGLAISLPMTCYHPEPGGV